MTRSIAKEKERIKDDPKTNTNIDEAQQTK